MRATICRAIQAKGDRYCGSGTPASATSRPVRLRAETASGDWMVHRIMSCESRLTSGVSGERSAAERVHCTPGLGWLGSTAAGCGNRGARGRYERAESLVDGLGCGEEL